MSRIAEVHKQNMVDALNKEMLAMFKRISTNVTYTERELCTRFPHYPISVVNTVINKLVVDKELAVTTFDSGAVLYSRRPAFAPRKIMPLFADMPNWVVESRTGEVLAYCRKEIHARMIADALNEH